MYKTKSKKAESLTATRGALLHGIVVRVVAHVEERRTSYNVGIGQSSVGARDEDVCRDEARKVVSDGYSS